MQAAGPPSTRRPLAGRIYGVRLLYFPRGRRAVALALAVVAALDYIKEAVGDLSSLDRRPLKFDFGQFLQAAADLSGGRNPYNAYLDMHCSAWCLGGYIYTPLLAQVLRPIAGLSLPRAAGLWLLATHAMVLVTCVLLWRTLRGRTTAAALATMLAAGLLFQPLFENFSYVQIGVLLLLVLAGAAVLHLRGSPASNTAAGALVALAAIIKITPLLVAPGLLPVGWARGAGRRSVEAAGGIAGLLLAMLGLVALMLLTVPHTADFFTLVLPHIGGGTAVYENKSLPALVARVFNMAAELDGRNIAESTVLGPDSKYVTLAATALLLGPVLLTTAWMRPKEGMEWSARAAAFAACVAAMPIASTITWRHHMVINLLAMALTLPALWPVDGPPASRASRWLLALSYPLMAIPQDLANNLAHAGTFDHHGLFYATRYLVLQDLNLLGMFLLWLACMAALRGLREGEGAAAT